MHMLGTAEAAKTALQILAHGYAPQEGDYRSKGVSIYALKGFCTMYISLHADEFFCFLLILFPLLIFFSGTFLLSAVKKFAPSLRWQL